MFDMMKMMGKLGEVKTRMEKARKEIEESRFTGQAGQGAVKVVITGRKQVEDIEIAPALLNAESREALQDLLVLALNEAVAQADEKSKQAVKQATDGVLPPGLDLSALGLGA